MTQKDIAPYVIAANMAKLGFDEPCITSYDDEGGLRNPFDYNNSDWESPGKHQQMFHHAKHMVQNSMLNSNFIAAPAWSQVFRFFREKYDLHGCVDIYVTNPMHWYIKIDNIVENYYLYHSEDENLKYKTYEEAELACATKLVELTKDKQQ